ncbi:hypothetical protein JL36_10005 [Lactococcus cremoris]|nr:hypothetical protein JL36_10005 [Lactococcus cremoris]
MNASAFDIAERNKLAAISNLINGKLHSNWSPRLQRLNYLLLLTKDGLRAKIYDSKYNLLNYY